MRIEKGGNDLLVFFWGKGAGAVDQRVARMYQPGRRVEQRALPPGRPFDMRGRPFAPRLR